MLKQRWKVIVGLLLVLISLGSVLILRSTRFTLLPLGHGRLIAFYNNQYDLDSCAREFQVRGSFGQVINDGCFVEFCDDPIQNEYSTITSSDENVVGVLDFQLDSPLFMMCDFSSGKCSPCDTSEQEKADMLQKLKIDHPELK